MRSSNAPLSFLARFSLSPKAVSTELFPEVGGLSECQQSSFTHLRASKLAIIIGAPHPNMHPILIQQRREFEHLACHCYRIPRCLNISLMST